MSEGQCWLADVVNQGKHGWETELFGGHVLVSPQASKHLSFLGKLYDALLKQAAIKSKTM